MTDVLAKYPHIDLHYTRTHIPTHDLMPEGYRYADEVETEFWWHIRGAMQVTVRGCPPGEFWTDIAVPTTGE